MKNIVIIKNLPSNLVEEAIVVVKDKKKSLDIKYAKVQEKGNIIKGYMKEADFRNIENNKKDNRSYVVKEAEMILKDYFTKIEENKINEDKKKLEYKYKRIKYINFVLSGILFLTSLRIILT